MADLSTADPLIEALNWLRTHAGFLATFGGSDHVSGIAEPPYPHLTLSPASAGSDRALRWDTAPEIQVETYGPPDLTVGRAELRRLHYVALSALVELPRRAHDGSMTVVSRVNAVGAAQWSPLPLGQPRWLSVLELVVHPAPG